MGICGTYHSSSETLRSALTSYFQGQLHLSPLAPILRHPTLCLTLLLTQMSVDEVKMQSMSDNSASMNVNA
jgi:hypothetical protein